jgi:hypothetical protein
LAEVDVLSEVVGWSVDTSEDFGGFVGLSWVGVSRGTDRRELARPADAAS